ncbi:glycosyltransferase family 2 protein [Vibrio sp. RC27]
MNKKFHVFICTYNRKEHLKRCLDSFMSIYPNYRDLLSVSIIDNEDSNEICEMINLKYPEFEYISEPQKGLVNARNRAIKECKHEYLVFIDDDEIVNEDWIKNALVFLDEQPCEVMFGGAKTIYDDKTPEWIVKLDPFTYGSHQHGKLIDASGSGNVFIKHELFSKYNILFDHNFSKTGGEDSMLFRTLFTHGVKMAWNDRIWVDEIVESNRLNAEYIQSRAFRDGQCYARTFLPNTSIVNKITWLFKRLIKVPLVIIAYVKYRTSSDEYIKCSEKVTVMRELGQWSFWIKNSYLKMYE